VCINELPNGSIIKFDKAYINYQQFKKFNDRSITYVVPQKDNAKFTIVKELGLLNGEPRILKMKYSLQTISKILEGITVKR